MGPRVQLFLVKAYIGDNSIWSHILGSQLGIDRILLMGIFLLGGLCRFHVLRPFRGFGALVLLYW